MIRFNLSKLLEKLETAKGRRYTLKEVSERSGCDKNALSRIANHPDIIPSAKVIDQLVQFFFFELTRDEKRPHLDRNRMRSVIKDFVSVFPDPDNDEFWSYIEPEIRNNPAVTLDEIWSMYTRKRAPDRAKPVKETEIKSIIKAKILEAEATRQEDSDIELSLTSEEFDLLRKNLPPNMGGKAS
jgi:transcriptional regulator with XRE-family HTH domain